MIRNAEPDDIPALAQVWHDAWQIGHAGKVPVALEKLRTVESFAERLGPRVARGDTLVYDDEDAIMGLVILDGDELEQMHVTPSAQGRGIAAQLIAAGEAHLVANGTTTAHLICIPENARALAFYGKHGWCNVARGPEAVETSQGPLALECYRLEKDLA